jgi:hypothetical protein
VSSSEPRVTIPCVSCNDLVEITLSWHRRLKAENKTYRCDLCKTFDRISTDDDDLRFWLDAYGVTPKGSAEAHVTEHGLPDELVRLLGVISPEAA